MNTIRILTQAQAEAVYSAMCALNKVGGHVSVLFPAAPGSFTEPAIKSIKVRDGGAGVIDIVRHCGGPGNLEFYPDQTAFATAYRLDHGGALQDAVAAESAPLDYNQPGHVCPTTGRIAMTVAQAYARPDSPDRTFFAYDAEASAMGLECWRLIDGLDAGTQDPPATYTVEFANGRSRLSEPGYVVYMQRTKAERGIPA